MFLHPIFIFIKAERRNSEAKKDSMKKQFSHWRTYVFVALVSVLSLTLVGCEPEEEIENVLEEVVAGKENFSDSDNAEGTHNDEEERENNDDNATNNDEGEVEDVFVIQDSLVAVDLRLSVEWASCNVGATSPEEYGGYYAWGEIKEKSDYSWYTYKWCNGSEHSITKYCTSSVYGDIDGKTTLDLEDDVAYVVCNNENDESEGYWRMPTMDEINELMNKCDWEWVSVDGVKGYKVESRTNKNSIFLPAAGYCSDEKSALGSGEICNYWSSSLSEKGVCCIAYSHYSYEGDNLMTGYYNRRHGLSVRPVFVRQCKR